MIMLRKTLVSTLLTLTLVNCSQIKPEPQEACNFAQNSDEQRLSWGSNLPIMFKIHKDMPAEAKQSILEAAKSWNTIASQNVIEFSDMSAEGSPSESYADGNPMIFFKKDWEANKVSEQGRSIIVHKGARIVDADIWINAKNFNFTYYGQEFSPVKVDLVSLVVHEMGHALGLAHNSNYNSVMFASLRRGYDRREIDHLGDIESFGCEYGENLLNQQNIMALVERKKAARLASEASADEESTTEGTSEEASAGQAGSDPNLDEAEFASTLDRRRFN